MAAKSKQPKRKSSAKKHPVEVGAPERDMDEFMAGLFTAKFNAILKQVHIPTVHRPAKVPAQ